MRFFSRIRSLLANLLGKEKMERQLDNELQTYVEMATDEKIAAGISASWECCGLCAACFTV